jgi:hypothetical protein
MDDTVLHGSGGFKDPATDKQHDAPVMPGLVPTRAERLEYLDKLVGWAQNSGYGSIFRQEVPALLRKYLPTDVDADYPIISGPGVFDDRKDKRLEDRRKAQRLNQTNRLIYDQMMRDLKMSLAAAL